jgi:hypothetical protein
LGDIEESEIVAAQYMSNDPQIGFEGDLYVVVYPDTHNAEALNEWVVMVEDPDGDFLMGSM